VPWADAGLEITAKGMAMMAALMSAVRSFFMSRSCG
jgi:hypothetical protein